MGYLIKGSVIKHQYSMDKSIPRINESRAANQ